MKFDREFIEKMANCHWLENCGAKNDFNFKHYYLDSKTLVKNSITSIDWENMCLDKLGDFTAFLCMNHKNEYSHYNDAVHFVKDNYIRLISEKITDMIIQKDLPKEISDYINFNILTLFMLNYYSEYYKSDFYDNMSEIYLFGHLPCGWNNGFVLY